MAIDFNAPSQVRPYANLGAFPATGAVKTIYIAEDTNYIYRWNGTAYIEISVADLVSYVPYTGATQDVNLGAYDAYVSKLWLYDSVNDNYGSVHFTDTDFHIEDADGHKMLVIEDGFMQIHKTDTIQSNLYTSGLTATRDHYLPDASGTIALTSDIPSLAGYVPTSRTLTINGVTQDLTANRTFTISTGITIGTTAITSGTVGRVLFEGTGNVVSESANLFWDNTNGRLGVGTSTPTVAFEVKKTIASGAIEGIKIEVNHSSSTSAATLDFIHTQFDARARIQSIAGAGGANPTLSFIIRSTTAMSILQSGNINIGTSTTDAGFKLDVNGTARFGISSATTVLGDYNGGGQSSVAHKIDFAGGWGWGVSNMAKNQWYFEIRSTGQSIFGSGNTNYLSLSASAKVQIDSTTQGFLPPRMTTTQKNAIATPAAGLMVYDSTLNLMSVYNGTIWISL
jgi:hypothetical protein